MGQLAGISYALEGPQVPQVVLLVQNMTLQSLHECFLRSKLPHRQRVVFSDTVLLYQRL